MWEEGARIYGIREHLIIFRELGVDLIFQAEGSKYKKKKIQIGKQTNITIIYFFFLGTHLP